MQCRTVLVLPPCNRPNQGVPTMFRCRFLRLAFSLLALALVADIGQSQPPAKDLHGDPLPPGAVARLGTTRCRHDYQIVFAGFHPDGKSVISVSVDGVVCA